MHCFAESSYYISGELEKSKSRKGDLEASAEMSEGAGPC